MIDSNKTLSLFSAIEKYQSIILESYETDSKTAKSYLDISDKLKCFMDESTLSSEEALRTFYSQTVGLPAFDLPCKKSDKRSARAILMILDLLHGNEPKRKYIHNRVPFLPGYEGILENYKFAMMNDQKSEGTIISRIGRIRIFFTYLYNSKCLNLESLTRDNLLGFISSLDCQYSSQGRASILYTLRNFFSYGEFSEKISFDPIPFLTGLHSRKHERLNSFYTPNEVCRLLEKVDRDTPWGKAIYLMMLLASVYGLRTSDIKSISLDDIDWRQRTIRVTQYKTKRQIILPITDEILYAMLDYLKNTRPKSSYRNVFIRLRRPYIPYSMNDHFGNKIQPYFEKAGINTDGKHHGLHSLRHSLATCLLGDGVSINEIASILGHSSASATTAYIWSDIEHLVSAAMEVPSHD